MPLQPLNCDHDPSRWLHCPQTVFLRGVWNFHTVCMTRRRERERQTKRVKERRGLRHNMTRTGAESYSHVFFVCFCFPFFNVTLLKLKWFRNLSKKQKLQRSMDTPCHLFSIIKFSAKIVKLLELMLKFHLSTFFLNFCGRKRKNPTKQNKMSLSLSH